MDTISKAASLAFWLITEKHKPKNVAMIIAMNKYHISRDPRLTYREEVRLKLKELLLPEPLFPEIQEVNHE